MTVTHFGLLQAILDDPADDTPRLVLADWLEDNGQSERADRPVRPAAFWQQAPNGERWISGVHLPLLRP